MTDGVLAPQGLASATAGAPSAAAFAMRHVGQPEEVAGVVAFLAPFNAAGGTEVEITVNGGRGQI